MKKLTFLLTLITAFFMSTINTTYAQVTFQDAETQLGSQSAFVILLDTSNKKIAENEWKDLIKKYGKIEKNKKAGLWSTYDIQIDQVKSNVPLDFYIKWNIQDDNSKAYVFVDDGNGFLQKTHESSDGIVEFLNEYARNVHKKNTEEQLKKEVKILDKKRKDFEKLTKQKEKLLNEIEKYEKKIAEAEAKIEQNLIDQKTKQGEVQDQETLLEEIKQELSDI